MKTPALRQQGFALLELTAALLIAALLAAWGAASLADRAHDAAAQGAAIWMASLRQAVQGYVERHAPALRQAAHPGDLQDQGYAQWASPSVQELKAAGLLSAGFPEYGMRGMRARIQLLRGEDCPQASCRIEALIYSSRPLARRPAEPFSEQMVAQWLLAARGWGGAVSPRQPDRVAGAAFSFPNPLLPDAAALPAGTVAMALTAEQLGQMDYLRVGDERDPMLQGRASVQGDVSTQGSLQAEGYVRIGARHYARTACDTEGAVAREYFGGLLVCRNLAWASAGGSGGGGFSLNTVSGCGASMLNPVTGDCSCPVGYQPVRIADSGAASGADGRTRGYLCVG